MVRKSILQKYFSQIEISLKKKLNEKVTGHRKFVYEMLKFGSRIFEDGWSLGLTSAFVPYEILASINVSAMFIEYLGGILAKGGMAEPYLDKAENMGFSTDICSYHRSSIGIIKEGLIPEPTILLASNLLCDGAIKAIKRIGEYFNKDIFILNVPSELTDSSIDNLVDQYHQLIDYLEEETGRNFNYNKLKQSIIYNNQSREYLMEAFELCKNVPSPANSNDFRDFGAFMTLRGTKEGVDVARTYRDDLQERVDNGITGLPKEKYRLLWIQNRIQYRTDLTNLLEKKYEANIVVDELSHIWWEPMDESDPLRSLAKQWISFPLGGPGSRRLESLKKLAKDYKINGVINPAHLGCRQLLGASVLIKDAFQKIGIPLIDLNIDCVDKRNYSPGQLTTRIEAFMEMLSHF